MGSDGKPHVCEVCGKSQEHSLEVHLGGDKHVFDSFECAIRGLIPACPLCGTPLLGPGVQVGDLLYCSQACACLSNVMEVEGEGNQRATE
jgi:hypothetical protein